MHNLTKMLYSDTIGTIDHLKKEANHRRVLVPWDPRLPAKDWLLGKIGDIPRKKEFENALANIKVESEPVLQIIVPWHQRSVGLKQSFIEKISDPDIICQIPKALANLYIEPEPLVKLALTDKGIFIHRPKLQFLYINFYLLSYREADYHQTESS